MYGYCDLKHIKVIGYKDKAFIFHTLSYWQTPQ